MNEFFHETFGVSDELFNYLILPLLIFLARIADVSMNTVRIIFVLNGKKLISTLLGFFESLIWLLAIGQIFQQLDNWLSYLAYAAGFAMGIFTGMLIEEKLAVGKLVIRVISTKEFKELTRYMRKEHFRFTILDGETSSGDGQVLFTVIKRDRLPGFLEEMHRWHPNSFYTIESVKKASETGFSTDIPRRRGIGSWLTSIKRK